MTLQIGDTISNLIRRLVGRNSRTSGRHAGLSLPALAYEAPRRRAIRLALTCAMVITPRIALGEPISVQSPTVIVDTTNATTGHAFFVEKSGIDEDVFSALGWRSEEHTSELQSQSNLVCRLLLEKKKKKIIQNVNKKKKKKKNKNNKIK